MTDREFREWAAGKLKIEWPAYQYYINGRRANPAPTFTTVDELLRVADVVFGNTWTLKGGGSFCGLCKMKSYKVPQHIYGTSTSYIESIHIALRQVWKDEIGHAALKAVAEEEEK